MEPSDFFIDFFINESKRNGASFMTSESTKSFPNRRTIENSDLCADTHEKLQFLGKVGYKQAKNNISGLEIIAP